MTTVMVPADGSTYSCQDAAAESGAAGHPPGTKAALCARAKQRHRSVGAEAGDVLTRGLQGEPVTIVDLLSTDEGADLDFGPERLGLTARSAEL